MEYKIIEDKDDIFEVEFDDKVIPTVLSSELKSMGVDAYSYTPHPLLTGTRLHIDGKNPMKAFEKALKKVEKDWKEIRTLVEKSTPKK
ncbi:MAG: hypothetical protein ABIJ04_08865 [Bacteroidota bacterium]